MSRRSRTTSRCTPATTSSSATSSGAGGTGAVSGVSSVFPRPFLELADALRRGDDQAAGVAQARIAQAVDAIAGADIALLKAALSLQGLPAGPDQGGARPTDARAAGNAAHRRARPHLTTQHSSRIGRQLILSMSIHRIPKLRSRPSAPPSSPAARHPAASAGPPPTGWPATDGRWRSWTSTGSPRNSPRRGGRQVLGGHPRCRGRHLRRELGAGGHLAGRGGAAADHRAGQRRRRELADRVHGRHPGRVGPGVQRQHARHLPGDPTRVCRR